MLLKEFIDSCITSQLTDLKEAVFTYFNLFDIQQKYGSELDEIGALLNCNRDSLQDDIYRKKITAYIYKYASTGTLEDLINIVKNITGSSIVNITHSENGSVALTVNGNMGYYIEKNFREFVESSLLAGVQLKYIVYVGDADSFAFSSPGGVANIPGKGFSSIANPTHGGLFVYIIV